MPFIINKLGPMESCLILKWILCYVQSFVRPLTPSDDQMIS